MTQQISTPELASRRIFIQYLNPEILSLYGTDHRAISKEIYQNILRITKYALLLSDDSLIIPASYLFEVDFIDRFLKDVDPIRAAGILQFASPTSDLHKYADKKKQEYRDELVLFPEYEQQESPKIKNKPLIWVPRKDRSSSHDISVAWKEELRNKRGVWQQILRRKSPRPSRLPSKLETEIDAIPARLENRAFIYRFVAPLLPLSLNTGEETNVSMLISRAYLESYLEELNAIIIVDTPLGKLDCDLPQLDKNGYHRTFSFNDLNIFFRNINLNFHIENILKWNELIELRSAFIFRWLKNLVVKNAFISDRPLEAAILKSKYNSSEMPIHFTGRKPLQIIYDHMSRLFDKVSPLLETYPATQENILEETRPPALPPPLKLPSDFLNSTKNTVPQTYLNGVFEFLVELALFNTEKARRAITDQAGFEKNLISQIDFEGSTREFLSQLLSVVSNFGSLDNGRDALVAFLNAVKANVGEDKKIIIDGFIEKQRGRN